MSFLVDSNICCVLTVPEFVCLLCVTLGNKHIRLAEFKENS